MRKRKGKPTLAGFAILYGNNSIENIFGSGEDRAPLLATKADADMELAWRKERYSGDDSYVVQVEIREVKPRKRK